MMCAEEYLVRGAEFLDEATENLTFAEFEWAAEETWRGVAWILCALSDSAREPALGPKGVFPAAGTLTELLEEVGNPPNSSRIVARLESSRDVLASPNPAREKLVEELVFAAWELHDACGRALAIADDRLGSKLMLADASPGRVNSSVIHRRTALKLLAATVVAPLQACSKVEKDLRPPGAAAPTEPAPAVVEAASIASVTRLPPLQWPTSDPFLFCAHHNDAYPAGNASLGPAESLDGRHLGRDFDNKNSWRMYHGRTVPGFPRHPHRGFETVTVVRSGLLDHSDSMGATARYGGGDVQWLTAGEGIQHAEMFPLLKTESPNPLELFQIWLNLPAKDKMVPPHFTMLWNEGIPHIKERDSAGKGTDLRVIAGTYKGQKASAPPPDSWASKAESDLAIWTLKLEAGARFELPAVSAGTMRSLYVHQGAGAKIAGRAISNHHRVMIEDAGVVPIEAESEETEILLLQGRPIGEPVAKRGPFVMNTQDEIRQAYADYQQSQFGGWPWTGNDPVHTRDKGRFASHIDGRFEEPT